MPSVLSPWFKSPFTDMTGCILGHQYFGQCDDMEMKVMECFEAYGLTRGYEKCDALIQDFRECHTRRKRDSRFFEMRLERHRQYYAGERSKADLYAPRPRRDSYYNL